jgi:transposase InsO family protein
MSRDIADTGLVLPWNGVMPGKVIAMETLIGAALAADVELDVSAFCAARGISRQTFYKYRARFQAEGVAGLTQRSRAPKSSPGRIPIEVEDLIVALRKELEELGTEHGPATILFHLGRRHHGEFKMPSEATIWRILDRRGFITKTPQKRPKSSWRRFEASAPNELWQADCTKWVIATGQVEILSFEDDHSRVALRCRAWVTVTTEATWETFSEATARWGVPSGQLTDNGLNFSGKLRGIEVGFEINLRAAGVKAITSKPFHPQTCGKVERFQQTMKKWLRNKQRRVGRHAADIAELQTWVDEFVNYYNNERPHRAIGRIPPIERWTAMPPATSHGAMSAPPITLKADHRGVLTYRQWRIMLGVTHRHQHAEILIDDTGHADIHVNATLVRRVHLDPGRGYIGTRSNKQ